MKRSRSSEKKYLEPEPVKKGPAPQHWSQFYFHIGAELEPVLVSTTKKSTEPVKTQTGSARLPAVVPVVE